MILRIQEFFPVAPVRPALALAFVLALGASSVAVPYSFTNIADTSMGFQSLNDPTASRPDVNNHGTVAFWATKQFTSVPGIYTGDGDSLTTIYELNLSNPGRRPSINDDGTVAFSVFTPGGSSGVYTGNGGPLTTIEDSSSPRTSYTAAAINNSGAVAMLAKPDTANGHYGVYRSDGGVVSEVAVEGMSGASAQHTDFLFLGDRMNNSGQVAVYAYPTGGGFPQTIYVGSGGPLSFVAQRTSNGETLSEPGLNDAGSVVYLFKAVVGNTGTALYKYNGGSTTTVIAPSFTNGLSADSSPQINNQEMIAYFGSLGGKTGLIIGDDSTFANVISVGDSLFGSTVQSIDSDFALNDRGDIAFFYKLAGGRSGVALASAVPEPAALLLAALGSACMLCGRFGARRFRGQTV